MSVACALDLRTGAPRMQYASIELKVIVQQVGIITRRKNTQTAVIDYFVDAEVLLKLETRKLKMETTYCVALGFFRINSTV